uniref:(northern house mosquito) hypothetical protein n=1 Tax=Culex pipiens TaxID=7175 RepID=A0A8D8DB67_CULPI
MVGQQPWVRPELQPGPIPAALSYLSGSDPLFPSRRSCWKSSAGCISAAVGWLSLPENQRCRNGRHPEASAHGWSSSRPKDQCCTRWNPFCLQFCGKFNG